MTEKRRAFVEGRIAHLREHLGALDLYGNTNDLRAVAARNEIAELKVELAAAEEVAADQPDDAQPPTPRRTRGKRGDA